MSYDPFYKAIEAKFRALSPVQQTNVRRRLASVRDRQIARQLFLLAVQETIALELTPGRPEPDPCRVVDNQSVGGAIRDAALSGICLMNEPHVP